MLEIFQHLKSENCFDKVVAIFYQHIEWSSYHCCITPNLCCWYWPEGVLKHFCRTWYMSILVKIYQPWHVLKYMIHVMWKLIDGLVSKERINLFSLLFAFLFWDACLIVCWNAIVDFLKALNIFFFFQGQWLWTTCEVYLWRRKVLRQRLQAEGQCQQGGSQTGGMDQSRCQLTAVYILFRPHNSLADGPFPDMTT